MIEKKMTLSELLQRIQMPEAVSGIVLGFESEMKQKEIQQHLRLLLEPGTWQEGLDKAKAMFEEDENGLKMLTLMLIASLESYQNYQKIGLSDEVFEDTFACFTRFVCEHMTSYGRYGFDREWWTVRQLSLMLFRIGTLEYEIINKDENLELSLHIPSDAKLTMSNCRASYESATTFFTQYFPEVHCHSISCHSWLLAPELKDVLREDSRILTFQKSFQIVEEYPEDKAYLEWVYQRSNKPLEELPETTSLQKNLKTYLLAGNQLGTAFGYLVKEPFVQS